MTCCKCWGRPLQNLQLLVHDAVVNLALAHVDSIFNMLPALVQLCLKLSALVLLLLRLFGVLLSLNLLLLLGDLVLE